MTAEQFNNKYKDYLEERFYGLDLHKPEAIEYLDKEFEELIKIPGFQYSQIKRKFNWFDFYCDNVPLSKVQEIESKLQEIYEV